MMTISKQMTGEIKIMVSNDVKEFTHEIILTVKTLPTDQIFVYNENVIISITDADK